MIIRTLILLLIILNNNTLSQPDIYCGTEDIQIESLKDSSYLKRFNHEMELYRNYLKTRTGGSGNILLIPILPA